MRASPLILGDGVSGVGYSYVGRAIDYRIRYHFAITPIEDLWAFEGALLVLGEGRSIPTRFQLTEACVGGFLTTLDLTVAAIAAHRRHPAYAEERTLARLCLALGALEAVARAGPVDWPPPYFGESLPETEEELLACVPADWVEDAAALSAAFVER